MSIVRKLPVFNLLDTLVNLEKGTERYHTYMHTARTLIEEAYAQPATNLGGRTYPYPELKEIVHEILDGLEEERAGVEDCTVIHILRDYCERQEGK